ncbi:hypothetical protein NQ318_014350 [Aromia moschata]|uniref:Uncharacterized protein n=1 Tax=Aromia moschata TaxID=1265417 RepID=A0AAV8Z0T5_9CUCU|nr:hypothetical protein NQ318_014350 [Aromia moschata]
MLLPERCERVSTSLNRTVSGDPFPALSSLDKPGALNGRETTEDDPRPGRPSTSKTDGNIEKIGKVIREDRRLNIRGLADIIGIDKEWFARFCMIVQHVQSLLKNDAKTPHSREKEIKNEHLRSHSKQH